MVAPPLSMLEYATEAGPPTPNVYKPAPWPDCRVKVGDNAAVRSVSVSPLGFVGRHFTLDRDRRRGLRREVERIALPAAGEVAPPGG